MKKSSKKIKKFDSQTFVEINKNKTVKFWIDAEVAENFKEVAKENNIKFVSVFEYLFISGLAFLKADIVEYVRKRVPEKKKRYLQSRMLNLKRIDASQVEAPRPKKQFFFQLYSKDYVALKNFQVEENVKMQFCYDILFEGYASRDPILVNFVNDCEKFKISSRKKNIQRLTEDEFILALDEKIAKTLLEDFTRKYDQRIFDTNIQEDLYNLQNSHKKKLEEEEQLEIEFTKKITELKKARTLQIQKLADGSNFGQDNE